MLDKDTLYRLYVIEQKTGPEIAKTAGVKSGQTVYNWLRKYDIPRRNRRDCQFPATPPKGILESLYVEQGLSMSNIAQQLDSSESSISMLLEKYGIPKRKQWEGMAGWNKGQPLPDWQRKLLSDFAKRRTGEKHPRYGVTLSDETRQKISESLKGRFRGSDNPNWKDGTNRDERSLWMQRYEYLEWRKAVFERDKYTCQMCKQLSTGNIEAHHIYPFADFPELRFEIDNGITLCQHCHETIKGQELNHTDQFVALIHQSSP